MSQLTEIELLDHIDPSMLDIKDADNKFTRIKKKYKQLFEAGVKIDTYQKLECVAGHWFNFGFVLGKKLAKEKYEFDRGIEP